jgi:hypothetical protein
MRRLLFSLALCLVVVSGVALRAWRPAAQETEESSLPKVTEQQLQTFISVYSAMQLNHDLTIEDALLPHHLSLGDFRQIERHVQGEPRLVERVRQALLAQAESQSALGVGPGAASSPVAPTPEPKPQ